MSQRPRLAGDGRLRVPEKVALYWKGFLRGRLSERAVDPFDWTDDRLLLAESFARLDLDDRAAAKSWFVRHGVVDRAGFVGSPSEPPDYYSDLLHWMRDRGPLDVADHRRDIEAEQTNVVWHLATLARLSETRLTRAWAPAWGRLVVDGPEGELIVGGPDAGKALMLPTTVDVLRREFPDDPKRQREAAEAERLRAVTSAWPVVALGEALWYTSWDGDDEQVGPDGPLPWDPKDKAKVLGTDWDHAVALERLLLAPYVVRAVERRFTMTFEPQDVGAEKRSVLVPREERVWHSILAPIYLQLFEALRRITEGEPGAAICHECGRPFVVLDARRRFFCNERERYRYAKRQQRRRLAEPDLVLDDGTEVQVKVRRRPS
jgi:hypothetical protein